MDDVNRIRQLLSENDWNPDIVVPMVCAETNANEVEKRDIEKTCGVILRGREFDKRMERWKC